MIKSESYFLLQKFLTMSFCKSSLKHWSDISKSIAFAERLRCSRNREQSRFNLYFSQYQSSSYSNDTQSFGLKAKIKLSERLLVFSRLSPRNLYARLLSIKDSYLKIKRTSYSSLLIVFQASRVHKNLARSLPVIVQDVIHENAGSELAKQSIRSKLNLSSYGFASGYEKENSLVSDITSDIIGSNLDLLILILSYSNPVYLSASIVLWLATCSELSMVEAILYQAIVSFIKKTALSEALFLTSNSRIADIFLIACITCKIPTIELLHGQPDRYIYRRRAMLELLSCGTYTALRQTPVEGYCHFFRTFTPEYINLKIPAANRRQQLSIEQNTSNSILFIGGTSHDATFVGSGLYNFERCIIDSIMSACVHSRWRLLYCVHPAERSGCLGRHIHPEIDKIFSLPFESNSLPRKAITVLSSAAWEYSYLGVPSMICLPSGFQPFRTLDLQNIECTYILNANSLRSEMIRFLAD